MRSSEWDAAYVGFGVAVLVFGLLVGGISACADGRPSLTTAIRAWHDDQRGVTCWVAEGKNDEAAIACLSDSQLERKP